MTRIRDIFLRIPESFFASYQQRLSIGCKTDEFSSFVQNRENDRENLILTDNCDINNLNYRF